MYFHQLPREIEELILEYADCEKVYDEFVENGEWKKDEYWRGKYTELKVIAKKHGVPCKGIRFILCNLPPGVIDNMSYTVSVARFLMDEYQTETKKLKTHRKKYKIKMMHYFLNFVFEHIDVLKHTKFIPVYKEKLVEFEAYGMNIDKYRLKD